MNAFESLSSTLEADATSSQPLSAMVAQAVTRYFNNLDGQATTNLYELVLNQVEEPLLTIVMQQVRGNQSKAAEMLGINRGTLRKKLKQYDLLDNE